MADHRAIDDLARSATEAYLERSSIGFLECAINLMMSHMSKQRVCEILRRQARFIEELD